MYVFSTKPTKLVWYSAYAEFKALRFRCIM